MLKTSTYFPSSPLLPSLTPPRLLLRIFIHPAPRFAAQASGLDVLHQQRRGPKLFAQSFVQVFENVQASVESNQIDHLEWAHGMIQSKLEGSVDVLCGSNALLQHVKRFVADHGGRK